MRILIDGYNLLYVAGIPGRGFGKALERSRLGLLRFLVESLTPAELRETTVVFDAQDAPAGLPRALEYHGVTIRFAPRNQTADALIAELIDADRAPRQLIVVSSDHEVQRSARRRRARAVDSDAWHDEIRRRADAPARSPELPLKPSDPLVPDEVAAWLAQFGGEKLVEQVLEEERARRPSRPQTPPSPPAPSPPPASPKPRSKRRSRPRKDAQRSDKPNDLDLTNPFPPGYLEDIERELDDG